MSIYLGLLNIDISTNISTNILRWIKITHKKEQFRNVVIFFCNNSVLYRHNIYVSDTSMYP